VTSGGAPRAGAPLAFRRGDHPDARVSAQRVVEGTRAAVHPADDEEARLHPLPGEAFTEAGEVVGEGHEERYRRNRPRFLGPG